MAARKRLKREERRRQIIEVALATVAEHGVRGATLARIAEGVGVTYPALYAHFPKRRDILVAALDVLFARIQDIHRLSYRDDAVEHLREIGMAHSRLVASAEEGFVFPLFEFIAASPEEGLREELKDRETALVANLADIVRRGQGDGSVSPHVDPEQIAWLLVSRAWTEDIAALMGLSSQWDSTRSGRMLDLILDPLAPQC